MGELKSMKKQNIIFVILLFTILSCSSMTPHQNPDKLHESYHQTPAINDTLLEVKSFISFQQGNNKYTFPIGLYKPVEKIGQEIYYLSPRGTYVDPIGHGFFVEGGIKMNIETGNLKFISFLGSLRIGEQNIRDYPDRIKILMRGNNS